MCKSPKFTELVDLGSVCKVVSSCYWTVVVRSTGSDVVFDEKYDGEESSTRRWRKRRSMYQATDSADSLSESEVVSYCSYSKRLFTLVHCFRICLLNFMCKMRYYRMIVMGMRLITSDALRKQVCNCNWIMERIRGTVQLYLHYINQYWYIVTLTKTLEILMVLAVVDSW